MGNMTHNLVRLVSRVQDLPYSWPGPWGANATRNAAKGTWAGKHALLAEELRSVGVRSQPLLMVGALVPPLWPDLLSGAEDILEVHECLTVETDWAGPLLVDVTWHPAAVRQGLPGTLAWSGLDDMVPAVQPQASYAVREKVKSVTQGRFSEPPDGYEFIFNGGREAGGPAMRHFGRRAPARLYAPWPLLNDG